MNKQKQQQQLTIKKAKYLSDLNEIENSYQNQKFKSSIRNNYKLR